MIYSTYQESDSYDEADSYVEAQADSLDIPESDSALRKIGRHALDVTKIVVGVAGGIIIAQRFSGRNK